ncbi:hypothetical protein [Halothermothrix orenii]|uniref:Uncharacterized protein n=1 Tax=Halothermothrix orenii (strain H 168 / OCM 544 / DSM 9562) TaxID=373903 RepID=B8D0F1_HALOH|nr:hypothetical protein [Halothermothrix orenii]ACL70887.1 hypothetical protein Hore_21420 [Halothermothrix orenii H 168]
MPFGYPKEIFKYPPIQYIPLNLNRLEQGNSPFNSESINFELYTYREKQQLLNKLRLLNIDKDYDFNQEEIAILVFNTRVDLIKYRGYEVIMVGEIIKNYFQLFTITTRYFYKDRILFNLYNGDTAEVLDRESFEYNNL